MATNYFELDINAPIFNELSKLPKDSWWHKICNDKDLYVNIRKYNRVDVYYKGAGVIRELRLDGKKNIVCDIHVKYLDKKWGATEEFYHKTTPNKIVDDLTAIKKNIEKVYATNRNGEEKKEQPEGKSEKEIQGDIYTNGKYLDTEYAYNYSDKLNEKGKQLRIRIDLLTVTDDGMLEFVELKRISDNRLLKKLDADSSSKDPEILTQMRYYKEFIEDCKKEFVPYYEKVQTIMKKIRVDNLLADVKIIGIEPEVRLMFAGYKDGKEKHPLRIERVNRIATLLEKHKIKSNIEELRKEMGIKP